MTAAGNITVLYPLMFAAGLACAAAAQPWPAASACTRTRPRASRCWRPPPASAARRLRRSRTSASARHGHHHHPRQAPHYRSPPQPSQVPRTASRNGAACSVSSLTWCCPSSPRRLGMLRRDNWTARVATGVQLRAIDGGKSQGWGDPGAAISHATSGSAEQKDLTGKATALASKASRPGGFTTRSHPEGARPLDPAGRRPVKCPDLGVTAGQQYLFRLHRVGRVGLEPTTGRL